MYSRCTYLAAALALGGLAATAATLPAQAQTLTDWFSHAKIDGTVRAYNFDRLYSKPAAPNQSAAAVAGILNVQTAPFLGGFGAGASFFTTTNGGINPGNAHLDSTLIGTRTSINALGQAYLQYKRDWLLARIGDQELDTPWMGSSDSRMLPATYQAAYGEVEPLAGLKLIGLREFSWKSRTSGDYYQDNLYYPSTYNGDTLYGGGSGINMTAPNANGTLAFGATYAGHGIKASGWYYNFYDFAQMGYGDASYTYKTGTGINPFIAGQALTESDGNSLLNANRGASAINGYVGNGVNATAYGIKAGFDYSLGSDLFDGGEVYIAYNKIEQNNGSIGAGTIVSPYTNSYATDPLYTTSMIRGLVELGPGDGWKVGLTQYMFHKQVKAMFAFASYSTLLNGSSNDLYADLTYSPGGRFKGFSIRDRVELSQGNSKYKNGSGGNLGGSFIYNRVMLQYNF